MMLKNPPLSPEEPTSPLVATQTPRGVAGTMVTSTPKSILRTIPKPTVELATNSLKRIQSNTYQTANKLLVASRLVRSFLIPLHCKYS